MNNFALGSGKTHVASLHLTSQSTSTCHWLVPFIAYYFPNQVHQPPLGYINIYQFTKKPQNLICQKWWQSYNLCQTVSSALCLTSVCKIYPLCTSAEGLAGFAQITTCSNSWILQKKHLQPAHTQLRSFIWIWRGKNFNSNERFLYL